MSEEGRLQVRQHHRFQEHEWRVVRLGWILMLVFVVAGMAGLLATGPFSWSSATSPSGAVRVEHQRVTHFEADDSLTLHLGPQTVDAATDTSTVRLTGSWFSAVDVQSVSPQPAAQRLLPGGTELEFDVAELGDLQVTVTFRAQRYGVIDGTVTAAGEAVTVRQLVLP